MRAYPDYKDTNFDWLGKVPSHWELGKLGICFSERNEKVSDTEYPALSVTKNGIVPQMEHVAKTDAGDNRKKVCANDFVINSRSDRKGSAGVSGLDGSVSLISIVLKPKYYLPKFAHHLFRSYNFQEEFYRYGKGIVADLWSTRFAEMKNIVVPLVPKDEQEAIANFLDRETNRIDRLIAEKQNFIKLLKEKRQALISHVVTKGLDPNVKMKDSGIEWIGEVPAHWEKKKIKQILKSVSSGTSVNAADTPAGDNQIGVLKTSAVYGGDFDYRKNKTVIEEDLNRVSCPLKHGTLIVSRMNTPDLVGAAGYVDDAPSNIFLPDRLWQIEFTGKVETQFVHYWTLTGAYRHQVKLSCEGTSSTMQNISQDDFKNYVFVMPERYEQIEIIKYIKEKTFDISNLEVETKRSIELLKEHRTALISAAVTGKIDVRSAKEAAVTEKACA